MDRISIISENIKLGDEMAHEGAAVADTQVFEMNQRKDGFTFIRLYDVEYLQMLELCKFQIPNSLIHER